MAASERAEALLDEIGELYAIVLRIARRVHDGDEAMTATQRLALIEIAAAGPMRLRNLARRMETTPATATRAVDALEELGFVRRKPEPADRRGVLVVATPRGRRWAERRRAMLREVIATLSEAKIPERLIRDMAQLNKALREATGHDDAARASLLAP